MARRGWKNPPRRKRVARAAADQAAHPSASRASGAYLYGILGTVWLGLAFVLVHATATDVRLDGGLRATGSVERISDATRTREETAHVAFVTSDGRSVRTSVYTGLFAHEPAPGDRVVLAYDPRNPLHARLIGADDLSLTAILFVAVSIASTATYITNRSRTGPS